MDQLIALPTNEATSDELGLTERDLERMYDEGWTLGEAVSLCRCMEHFNPELNEDFALARMKKITDAVQKRKEFQALQVAK